jgi:hypothetical protein
MKPKQPKQAKKSGRATTDERGHSTWEWQTDTGSFKRNSDTQELKRLQDAGLSVTDTSGQQSSIDPYNNSAVEPTRPEEAAKKPRRNYIDYLRKLSEEIKQGELLQNHKKIAALGDRVIFQVVGKPDNVMDPGVLEFSPVIYAHWSGERAPQVLERLRKRMRARAGDVPYTAARLVQELIDPSNVGALSFGIWNADRVLTEEDSHGDAGVVLIDVSTGAMRFKCFGGYLRATADGRRVLPYRHLAAFEERGKD